MNYILWLVLLLTRSCLMQEEYPEAYYTDHHYAPAKTGTFASLSLYIFNTAMNFENDMLEVTCLINMVWSDLRKAGLTTELIVFDNMKDNENYEKAMAVTWVPSFVKRIQAFNFFKGELKNAQKLIVVPTGHLSYSTAVKLKIHCDQITYNYPFESYNCTQRVIVQESNETLKYTTMQLSVSNETRKTFGHQLVKARSTTAVKSYGEEFDIFKYQEIEFYFLIQRNSPRILSSVVIPIIIISIIDAMLFALGSSTLTKLAMIPAYFLYFDDVDLTNTVYTWPPIIKYFFSRFVSALLLGFWLVFNSLRQPQNPSQFRLVSQSLLNTWQKRLIAILLLTSLLNGLFSINFVTKKSAPQRILA